MSARATAEHLYRVSPATGTSLLAREPVISRVVPWIRWAVLVRHQPHLKLEVAEKAAELLDAAWPAWADTYRSEIARLSGVAVEDLKFKPGDKVRLKSEGGTPTIDLPLIESRSDSIRFGLRNCVALCTDVYSSKIWTRVGSPSDETYGCSPGVVRQTVSDYRSLARMCSNWFESAFYAITKEAFGGHAWRRLESMELEVTTVALHVDGEYDEYDLEAWLFTPDDQPNLENTQLRDFMTDALEYEGDVREIRDIEAESFWMSMPATGQGANGELAARRFVYLVRPLQSVLHVVGVGLDDSTTSDLASNVALKVSSYLASRL